MLEWLTILWRTTSRRSDPALRRRQSIPVIVKCFKAGINTRYISPVELHVHVHQTLIEHRRHSNGKANEESQCFTQFSLVFERQESRRSTFLRSRQQRDKKAGVGRAFGCCGCRVRLFPTSAHDSMEEAVRKGTMTEKEGRAILAKCAGSALRLLERCVLRGQVIICSNGDRSWLEESLDGEAYQELRQFLKARAIPVLSAREHARLQGLIDVRAMQGAGRALAAHPRDNSSLLAFYI
ncbi:unnamed protein product [Vitrella brassicaformis CCMP3155]|uniref:Uncharacterized protein n=1 Tax=Vitrella brassicaformis (strain CCMP3155) TaxID=1169540 RepID=A0A0G4FC91_VITBC|nr:unnamed protein product [Vitrella brassicaformis CCMP3155]|eukprot:CEM10218.1 unnamed protein product [Vitrella brassicaformis CCMP3155]